MGWGIRQRERGLKDIEMGEKLRSRVRRSNNCLERRGFHLSRGPGSRREAERSHQSSAHVGWKETECCMQGLNQYHTSVLVLFCEN